MFYFFLFIFGLCMGSFLAAFTFREEKGISIVRGRSFCPRCRAPIFWYDNIPLISFLFLKGKCRHCKKKISLRYPLIELSSGVLFMLAGLLYLNGNFTNWFFGNSGLLGLLVLFIILFSSIALFVVDIESMVLPDKFIFTMFIVSIFVFMFSDTPYFFDHMMSAFAASSFLLVLHLITKGKGMGLGDVKLVIPYGFILGPSTTLTFMFVSFVLGGIFGVFLLLSKKAKLKSKLPFGPFLIIGFFITLLFYHQIGTLQIFKPFL